MTTFGLVHGGFHGAWCWDRLVPHLVERGHRAVAMDLPLDDPDATLADYVDVVVDALADVDEPVVVVGHSMGGMVIPHVPALRPVARLVFLCPMVEGPDRPGADLPHGPSATIDMASLSFDGGLTSVSAEGAAEHFYNECTPEDVAWAVARLRPQTRAAVMPLDRPRVPVPTSLVICTDDRARNIEHLRHVTAPNLGVAPIEVPGDHSPFLSRPAELAAVLDDLARQP
jgi:pimeloyl-ACP methyl ester carboxylesterase